ncbi:hypothetical protein HF324_21830 [Chitinophaga oryzae]|uniref:DUF4188 domain-containing protein n=1 Tax=Chitinophaga oryzae TaxID=2725414 RepID=A0AAE6ZIG0_9BACT|nr:hypothetical protein [Chitinophaga oryzae]QJB33831.1 hypothetical protein HF329_21930 [Chitinophaga oryzae]QJB40357.1 hypothetical protein HF324_21830 [Chitinophaga oryzae]
MYEVEITNGENIVFVNSIRARSFKGFCWLWLHVPAIIRSVKQHYGAYECIPALVSPLQIVMVSYWLSYRELGEYHQSLSHRRLMDFVKRNPHALGMYFESYAPGKSGKYINGAFGLAKNFRRKL